MSGYPNTADIQELRECLLALKVEDAAVEKARLDQVDADKRLDKAQERVRSYTQKIDELMADMDCAQPGNHGYKNRLLVLLTGLSER